MSVRGPDRTLWYGVLSMLGSIGCATRLVFSGNQGRFWDLEHVLWGAASLALAGLTVFLCRRLGRDRATRRLDPVVSSALEAWERLGPQIAALPESAGREALQAQFEALRTGTREFSLRMVLLGTLGAGKTAVAKALGAAEAGAEGASANAANPWGVQVSWPGWKHSVWIKDAPGVSRGDDAGALGEAEARQLAEQADLILWVCEADLTGTEIRMLDEWIRAEKRVLLLVNKQDLRTDTDAAQLLALIRERVRTFLAAEDVIGVVAAPRSVETLVEQPDGRFERVWEQPEPRLGDLRARLKRLLDEEGAALREANLKAQARMLERSVREERTEGLRRESFEKIDAFSITSAASVFANPIPGLDLAGSAVASYPLLRELALIHGVTLTDREVESLASEVGGQMVRLGMREAATSLIAGLMKRTILTYAAGGAVQALAMAYLVQVAGRSFVEYLERGRQWGPGGVEGVVLRQFESLSRIAFLKRFLRMAAAQALGTVTTAATYDRRGTPA